MRYTGSLVISKQALLNYKDNLDYMWRMEQSDDNRSHLFGRMCMFDELLKDGLESYNYHKNRLREHYIWNRGYNTSNISELFKFLHHPEPYPIEEAIHLYNLLAWSVKHQDEVDKLLKELGEEVLW